MKFSTLTIFRLPTSSEEAGGSHDDVELRKLSNVEVAAEGTSGSRFTATISGVLQATLSTFDDNPIRINAETIEISGVLYPPDVDGLESKYGSWVLR